MEDRTIFTVKMPDIGEGVVEGEVISWLKQLNETLQQDEPVVVVMTDKATVELPAPYPGRLVKQYYEVGQMAIKDKPLYDIEVQSSVSVTEEKEPVSKAPSPEVSLPVKKAQASTNSSKVLAAPPTRKLAQEMAVDIQQVVGTGKEGIVTAEDVLKHQTGTGRAVSTPPLRLLGDQERPIVGIRNLMAKKMQEANDTIPHFSYFEQVDATRLVQLRQSFKEEAAKQGIAVTYMPFLIRALSLTLKRYPEVNSSVDTEKNKLIIHRQHNVGIAITTRLGLIVPVLKNTDQMTLQEIVIAYDTMKEAALANKLHPSDMKEATITLSNFGVLGGGGLWATPIINYPEVAILAIGRIHQQPIVKNGEIVIRDVLNLSWSFDHRVIDGDLAASFSHHFSTLLQNPAPLL